MSKVCASDYHHPGSRFYNDSMNCDYFSSDKSYPGSSLCQNLSVEAIIGGLVHTPNGYISMFNCPQCGCTATDIIKLNDLNDRTR